MRSSRAIILFIVATLFSITTAARAATIDVASFGAIPNDLVDDAEAINAAVAEAVPGDVVLLGAGTYRISTSISIPRTRVSLRGAGQASTIVLFTGSSPAPLVELPEGSSEIAVYELTLDGGANGAAEAGVAARKGARHDIHHLTIRNLPREGAHGVFFSEEVTGSRIADNTIASIGVGTEWGGGIRVAWRSSGNEILRNVISGTGRGGIFCNDGSTDTIIRNNRVSGSGTGRPKTAGGWPVTLGLEVWNGCSRAIIEDNVVDAWLSLDKSDFSAVRRNRVTGTPGRWAYIGVELADTSNVVFTGNRVESGAQMGVSVSGGGRPKDYVYWGHNKISGAANWALQLQGEGPGARYHYFYDTAFRSTLPAAGNQEVLYPEWPSGQGFRVNDNARHITVDACAIENNTTAIQLVGGTATLSDVSFLDNRINGNGAVYDQSGGPFERIEWVGNTVSGVFPPSPRARPATEMLVSGALQPGSPIGFSVAPSAGIEAVLWDFGDGIPSRSVSPSFTYAAPGDYEVTAIVWRTGGVATRVVQTLRIGAGPSRIGNLSFRAVAGPGAQTLIVGLANAGGAKQVLVRGSGPGLQQFGVSSLLPNPMLTLFQDSTAIAANDDWQTPNQSAIEAASAQVAAFSMQPADAALIASVSARSYTAHVTGNGAGSGVALAEIYDLDPPASASRLVNLSGRGQVGTGENVLIAGFNVHGARSRRVLIRGVGPALAPFGVPGTLGDPLLGLFDDNRALLRRNAGWSSHPLASQIASVAAQVSAFPLPSGSRDAALLVTLLPGSYTAHLRGESGGTGVGLIEIYDADEAVVASGVNSRIAAMYAMQNIPSCGDGACSATESCGGCPQDCGPCSGPGSGPGSGPDPGVCTCNDSNPCTMDACTSSGCSFVPVDCDDHDPCTTDTCSPATGACANVPNGTCAPPNPCAGVSCDDGNGCTVDTCVNGQCQHEPNSCDDGNDCTVDWCSAHTCFNAPIGACSACDDGDDCTDDVYESGACRHTANGSCSPPDPCGGCDDGDPCTMDFCMAFHCMYWPNGSCDPCANMSCDDGDGCTDDRCDNGVCSHTDNGGCVSDPCEGVRCDDDDPCTDDHCEGGSCRHDDNGGCGGGDPCDGVACDDGDDCTDDYCDGGDCHHDDNGWCGGGGGDPCANVNCDDGDDCTDDYCDNGSCHHDDNGWCGGGGDPCADVNCDDGDGCTDDYCDNGSCVSYDNGWCWWGGDPCDGVVCDDGDDCTDDYCDNGSCGSYDNGSCWWAWE